MKQLQQPLTILYDSATTALHCTAKVWTQEHGYIGTADGGGGLTDDVIVSKNVYLPLNRGNGTSSRSFVILKREL